MSSDEIRFFIFYLDEWTQNSGKLTLKMFNSNAVQLKK